MPRRLNLPGADELFRGQQAPNQAQPTPADDDANTQVRPTGRVRHDEKITVYVSTAELLNLEQTRLRLRADYGINVDRGRLVREAIDMLVDDLNAYGDAAPVIERLRQ